MSSVSKMNTTNQFFVPTIAEQINTNNTVLKNATSIGCSSIDTLKNSVLTALGQSSQAIATLILTTGAAQPGATPAGIAAATTTQAGWVTASAMGYRAASDLNSIQRVMEGAWISGAANVFLMLNQLGEFSTPLAQQGLAGVLVSLSQNPVDPTAWPIFTGPMGIIPVFLNPMFNFIKVGDAASAAGYAAYYAANVLSATPSVVANYDGVFNYCTGGALHLSADAQTFIAEWINSESLTTIAIANALAAAATQPLL